VAHLAAPCLAKKKRKREGEGNGEGALSLSQRLESRACLVGEGVDFAVQHRIL
jgi:hypothetical protein